MNYSPTSMAGGRQAPFSRMESLRHGFLECLEMIEQHQEMSLPSGFIADYQALGWIEIKDGVLQITDTGMSIVRFMKKRAHNGGRA